MALNQLQYMSLLSRQLSFADMKTRLQHSAKDEDLKPMAALDRWDQFSAKQFLWKTWEMEHHLQNFQCRFSFSLTLTYRLMKKHV